MFSGVLREYMYTSSSINWVCFEKKDTSQPLLGRVWPLVLKGVWRDVCFLVFGLIARSMAVDRGGQMLRLSVRCFAMLWLGCAVVAVYFSMILLAAAIFYPSVCFVFGANEISCAAMFFVVYGRRSAWSGEGVGWVR